MEPLTATEVRVRESMYYADFVRAKEALTKADVSMSYFCVSSPSSEKDTYTLIPNGYELTMKQSRFGDPAKLIRAYLVQHDQSGKTIQWKGAASSSYKGMLVPTVFDHFFSLPSNGRQKWKEKELKRIRLESEKTMSYDYDDDDFDCPCTCDECMDAIYSKDKKMNYATANIVATTVTPTEEKQRDYLSKRLDTVYYEKRDELHTFFKLDPVKGPNTLRDFIQKIKDGDISYDEKKLDSKVYYTGDLVNWIRWTKDAADQEGYDAALEKLEAAQQEALDTIRILSPEEGLKALKAFEAQTFH